MMTGHHKRRTLIEELKRLYRQLAAITLRKRMDSYREDARGSDDVVSATLQNRLDALSQQAAGNPDNAASQGGGEGESTAPLAPVTGRPFNKPKGAFVMRLLKGFPQYLKRQRKGQTIQPHLSQQLQNSTWDHLHSAVRLSRQGEPATAKMHVDIAMSALDELAHYMPEVDYRLFQAEVQEQINKIRKLPD